MPLLLFDFDGTLADTLEPMRLALNQLSQKYHYPLISKEKLPFLKTLPAKQAIKAMGWHPLLVPFILGEAGARVRKSIQSVSLAHADLHKVLFQLQQNCICSLAVMSSNSVKTVQSFLNYHHLPVFSFIHSTSSLWNKAAHLKKIIKKQKISREDVIYIGDECRDIEAAGKVGVQIAVVTWGYNDNLALIAHNPDYIINHPADLMQILKSF